jgi:uncharacterized protein YcfJ
MNNRILIALGSLVLGGAAVTAQAGDHDRYRHDRDRDRYAEVVRVEPVIARVHYTVPVEQCWDEARVVRGGSSRHVIVGALIGAAIGKHVGEIHGDRAAGVVGGALIGAGIGGNIDRDRGDYRGQREVVRHCETRDEERWDDQVVAYRVSYIYNGRRDVVRLDYDPGRWFRVDEARRHG